ncbi:glycosyltransferase [Enterococcus faecium]|nr:glycosyltransferase [Enterococcus faecium]HAQ0320869.1 glycosyltransferase [Enterococcus faecium]
MKKKILFVTNHFGFSNGVATVLRNLIANLDENEYEISLLAIYELNQEFAAPIINKIKVIQGYNFYFRGMDKIINLIPSKMIYKKFIKEEYDLEIAFQFGIPTKCISVSSNPNKLCWMHGYDSKMKLEKYYKKFPKVINVSKAGMKKMISVGFDESMCDYCYNIIDEVSIKEAAKESCPLVKTHKYSVVTVGRLSPEKGFMRYLSCIKEIVKTYKDVEFWIIGGGSEEKKMRQYIKDNSLDEFVKMPGRQKNPYKFVTAADLYFCCSYREGFSTSCQEAALLSVPVVSVEVDGAEELKELAGCGSVIKNDKESICNELLRILEDEKLIEKWRKQANISQKIFYKKERIKHVDSILKSSMNNT